MLGGSATLSNGTDVSIPDGTGTYVHSPITISIAPAGATVTRIDWSFAIVHPDGRDLDVDLNDHTQTTAYHANLWQGTFAGGYNSGANPSASGTLTAGALMGLPVNQTWYLAAADVAAPDPGYINSWTITVYWVDASETLSTTGVVCCEGNPVQGTSYSYTVGASTSSLGHTVEYSFNWGDGTSSSYSTSTSASHSWSTTGQKFIAVTARCQTHTSISANNSSANYYVMVQPPVETTSVPGTISGDASPVQGTSYSYTVGASSSSLGHTVEYSFNWGDGSSSAWSTSTTAPHAWSTTGQKTIIVTARCQTHTSITNNNSPGKSVTVQPVASSLTVATPNGGEDWVAGTTHSITWSISGSTANVWYYKVGLSTDGGATWPAAGTANDLTPNGIVDPNARSFSWTIANSMNTTHARIRVRAIDFNGTVIGTLSDASDANFTISSGTNPAIRVEPLQLTVACGSQMAVAPSSVGPVEFVQVDSSASLTPSSGQTSTEVVGGVVSAAGKALRPRPATVKPGRTSFGPQYHTNVVTVKFRDGMNLRVRDGKLVESGTGRISSAIDAAGSVVQGRWERVDSLPEGQIESLRQTAQKRLGKEIADLNLQFYLFLPNGVGPGVAIDALNALDSVELAQGVPHVVPPTPPDYRSNQGYLNSAPAGVDAWSAWTTYGARGAGIKLADIEYSFNQNHLDLPSVNVVGLTLTGTNIDHGTAVLGVIAAKDDGKGTTGIAPDCSLYFSSVGDGSLDHTPSAITTALGYLGAGDVMLLELQFEEARKTVPGQIAYVPIEWYKPAYDRIVVAVGLGVTVVEAAGNGNQNLDDDFYSDPSVNAGHTPFLPANDSGAILVGAGEPAQGYGTPRSRCSFSDYGSTVDLQGWGRGVWTTGYGSALGSPFYDADGVNQEYTGQFNGTSSASPVVAGACVLLESAYKAKTGNVLSPEDVKQVLRSTGSPQQGNTSENIGPLPNVAAATGDILPTASGGSFRIHNEGQTSLSVNSLGLDQAASWISWYPQAPFTIPANSYRTVTVFVDCAQAPSGQTTRQVVVHSSDSSRDPYPGGVFVSVTGLAPAISVTPASQDFGSIPVATTTDRAFTVQNTGEGTLSGSATVSSPFSVVSGSP